MSTVRTHFNDAVEYLASEDAKREITLLFRSLLNCTLLDWSAELTDNQIKSLNQMVAKRRQGVPLSHILGKRAFWKSEFVVTSDVLDPRPDTETLVETALALSEPKKILELGVGSGALIQSLLLEWPSASGVGTDISKEALAVAKQNAINLGVSNRLELIETDWFKGVRGRFDLIVSNPPYISMDEYKKLDKELSFEPKIALTDDADGLSAYRTIAANFKNYLTPNGVLLLEIGHNQASLVKEIFSDQGHDDMKILKDINGKDRVVKVKPN